MILWGNDFQPEGLWIAAVWEFWEQTLIYCCSSLHLMHTISILKIMVFSNLTISALSLHPPAILFSLSAVSVGVWCSSERLCCLVSWSVWWRAWGTLEMITGTSCFIWEIKAEIQKPWNIRIKALSLPFITFLVLMFYLCFYYISLPDYPGSFFCLIPVPWCHIEHPCGIHLSPQVFVPGFPLVLAPFLLLYHSVAFLFACFGQSGTWWESRPWDDRDGFSCSLFWCPEPQLCPAAKKGIRARKVLSNPQKKQAIEAPKWSEIKADRICRGFSPKG